MLRVVGEDWWPYHVNNSTDGATSIYCRDASLAKKLWQLIAGTRKQHAVVEQTKWLLHEIKITITLFNYSSLCCCIYREHSQYVREDELLTWRYSSADGWASACIKAQISRCQAGEVSVLAMNRGKCTMSTNEWGDIQRVHIGSVFLTVWCFRFEPLLNQVNRHTTATIS